MKFTCPPCKDGQTIPTQFTCDGENLSPALAWSDLPEGTETLALILDDPDAVGGATWDHWVVFNIPASVTGFPEGMKELPKGAKGGQNSWGRTDYGGPCPPDCEHRYSFMLYALDTTLDLPKGATKQEVLVGMKGHILTRAHIVCLYERPDDTKACR